MNPKDYEECVLCDGKGRLLEVRIGHLERIVCPKCDVLGLVKKEVIPRRPVRTVQEL